MRVTGRDKFNKIKGLINFLVSVDAIFPYRFNKFLLGCFRHTNGKIGLLIRYILVRNLAKSCGDNVSIHPGAYLFNLKNVAIGSNISIHPLCYIDGLGGITIGNNISIAHNTSILTVNHTWDDSTIPIKYNEEIFSSVHIEDDVWIGCGCRILAGVKIKSRSVIAAGAVVTASVEGNCVIGGVPARLLKHI